MKIRTAFLIAILVAAATSRAATSQTKITIVNKVDSAITVDFYVGPLNAPTRVRSVAVAANGSHDETFTDTALTVLRATVRSACSSDAMISGDATYVVTMITAQGKYYCSVAKQQP